MLFNPSAREVERGTPVGHVVSQHVLLGKFQASERPCLQKAWCLRNDT